jgi:iron complex transport system substrate-binding protein
MKRSLSLLATVLLVATAACGDDADSNADTTAAGAATTEPASLETAAASEATSSAEPADAAFPVTIEHKYGETTIDAEPTRIVSIGFGEHDGLLALGVVPIAVRDWYGDQPYATWPWAQDELGDAGRPRCCRARAELRADRRPAARPDHRDLARA